MLNPLKPFTIALAKKALLKKIMETTREKEAPKPFKILFTLIFVLLMANPPGNCLVGETIQELTARYGNPISINNLPEEKTTMSFLKEDIYILTELNQGKTVLEGYIKKSNPFLGFTLQEIIPILEIHGGNTSHWTEKKYDTYSLFIQKEKSLTAVWDPTNGHFIIATNPRYDLWKISQKNKEPQK